MKTKTATIQFYSGAMQPEMDLTGYPLDLKDDTVKAMARAEITRSTGARIKKITVKTVESE